MRRGFSMTQLLGVIAIIGIVASVAAPRYAAVRDRNTADVIATSLRGIEQVAHARAAEHAERVRPVADTGGTINVGAASVLNHLVAAAASVDTDPADIDQQLATTPYVRFSDADPDLDGEPTVSMMRSGMCRQLVVDVDGDQGAIRDVDADVCLDTVADPDDPNGATPPPTPPLNVAGTGTQGELAVSGYASDPDLAYEIAYRHDGTDELTRYVTVAGVDATSDTQTITGLRNGTTYHVQVVALSGDGLKSDPATATGTPDDGFPTLDAPTVSATDAGLHATWDTSPVNDDTALYRITRVGDGAYECVRSASWVDSDPLASSADNIYTVAVLDGDTCHNNPAPGGESPPSDPVSGYTPTDLGPPQLTVADHTEAGVTLQWTDPDHGTHTGFEVRHRVVASPGVDADDDWSTPVDVDDVNEHVWPDLDRDRRHAFQVRAVDTTADPTRTSTWSNTLVTDLDTVELAGAGAIIIVDIDHLDDAGLPTARTIGHNGELGGTTASTVGTGDDERAVVNDVEFTVELPTDPARTQVRIGLSGTPIGDLNDPTAGDGGTATFRLVDVPDGIHTIDATPLDRNGTSVDQPSVSAAFTIDTVAPPLPDNLRAYTYDDTIDVDSQQVAWHTGRAYDLNDTAWFDIRHTVTDNGTVVAQDVRHFDRDDLTADAELYLPEDFDGLDLLGIHQRDIEVCYQIRTGETHPNGTSSFDSQNLSGWHDIDCVDLHGRLPGPTTVTASGNTAGSRIDVTWTRADYVDDGIVRNRYRLQRRYCPDSGSCGSWVAVDLFDPETFNYRDNDVYRGETWQYRVRGENRVGNGGYGTDEHAFPRQLQTRTRQVTGSRTQHERADQTRSSYQQPQRRTRTMTRSCTGTQWRTGGVRESACAWTGSGSRTSCNHGSRSFDVFDRGECWETRTSITGPEGEPRCREEAWGNGCGWNYGSWSSWSDVSSCSPSSTTDCRTVTRYTAWSPSPLRWRNVSSCTPSSGTLSRTYCDSYQRPTFGPWSSWEDVEPYPTATCSTRTATGRNPSSWPSYERQCRSLETTRPDPIPGA